MRRKLKKLFMLIIFLVISFFVYRMVIKKEPMDFAQKDTKSILVIDKFSKKNFREMEPLFMDFVKKEDIDQLEKNKKYISKIYVFSDSELYENSLDFTAVIDPGLYYYVALSKWGEYFEKTDGIYKVKDAYKEEIKNVLPSAETLYADYKNGLFFVSNKKDYLKKYLTEETQKNEKITTIIKENKSNLYTFIYNNENSKEFGIEFVSFTAILKNKIVSQRAKVYLNELIYSVFDYQPAERKLKSLIKEDSLYLSIEDFSKLEKILFNQYTLGSSTGGLGFGMGLFGINIKKELQNIDGELVVDFKDKKIHTLLKDVEMTKKLVGKFDKILRLDAGMISIDEANKSLTINLGEILPVNNEPSESKTQETTAPTEIYLSKDQFLYGHITPKQLKDVVPLENLDKGLIKEDIIIKGIGRTVEIQTNTTMENLANTIKHYREKIKNKN